LFHVAVMIDTGTSTINGVEGKISFNKDELEVTAVAKDDSILESWTTDPTYSNDEGTVSFGGGVKSFTGSSGKIITIDFLALKNTAAKVRFSTGAAILAADGQGTNILTAMNAGVYTLTAKETIPTAEQAGVDAPAPLVLGAFTSTEPTEQKSSNSIISSTHPDENKWYNMKTAEFSWVLPPDVTAIRSSVDTVSSSTPTKSRAPLSEKIISPVDEGVSYFHLQIKTPAGWGETETYRFQTDTQKPETFEISEAGPADGYGFLFDGQDKTSGIEKYIVQIDGAQEEEWKDDGSHKYVPQEGKPGSHTLFVKAVDFAGNFATSSVTFTLDPATPPTITDFKETISLGETLVVQGMARPNTAVSLSVSKDGTRETENKVMSGSDGKFMFALNNPEEGVYKIYATEAGRGVRSEPSPSVLITVSQPKFILFGKAALEYLTVLIPLATLLVLFVFILVFGWHRFKIFRVALQKEMEEIDTASRGSFSKIRKEINDDEAALKKSAPKERRKKEKEVIARLKKSIDDAEANVEKEISHARQKIKRPVKVTAQKI
jgi:hypothetical protein